MTVFFKKLIYKYLRRIWTQWYPALPMVELEDKHIANCTNLTNRLELLKQLPKHGIVAELGVERGNFSLEIINICNPKTLHLVDSWTTAAIEQECKQNLKEKQVEYHKEYSTTYLKLAEKNSLDWVYIDTDHTYNTT
ncbi:MAG: hypothetical protein HKP14_08220, partial [Bacteroidia bacterium]|nr:hypothetical protein [Bacteroidia bacterium]